MGVRLRWMYVDGEGVSSVWTSTKRLELTDAILSPSYGVLCCTRISTLDRMKVVFSDNVNYQYYSLK